MPKSRVNAAAAIVARRTMMRSHGVSEANLAQFVYRAPPLIERLVGRRPHMDLST